MDNDDLDITKGCKIVISISDNLDDLKLNSISHKPYIIDNLYIYAGVGVGVVTKDGLKPPKDYPAINPTPLKAIEKIYNIFGKNRVIYTAISIINGEELSKQTANAKVGVLGGLSILGTTGFVKPISSIAYIDSIETELNFIKSNGYNMAILTLGNSSFRYAKENYKLEQIVEIGNFIFDSLQIVKRLDIKNIIFICGVGKAVKVAQGHKNTHNRFGSINFIKLRDNIREQLRVEVDIESTKTVKGLSLQLKKIGKIDEFYNIVKLQTDTQLKKWSPLIAIESIILK
jgi:cobalt-precorrin-5B (C1)-methyltransferase